MKLFFTVTKKGLAVALGLTVAMFIALVWFSSLEASAIDGSTHARRMEYINGLKIKVDEENATFKETVIPKDFGKVYEGYNQLQTESGFDLTPFKGKEVTVYSYPVENQDKILTLIVYNNEIIGGDIAETKINGKMTGLGKY